MSILFISIFNQDKFVLKTRIILIIFS